MQLIECGFFSELKYLSMISFQFSNALILTTSTIEKTPMFSNIFFYRITKQKQSISQPYNYCFTDNSMSIWSMTHAKIQGILITPGFLNHMFTFIEDVEHVEGPVVSVFFYGLLLHWYIDRFHSHLYHWTLHSWTNCVNGYLIEKVKIIWIACTSLWINVNIDSF